jgi:RES domain-containing protein
VKPELYEDFGSLFDEELDSWFSADIACCDECYDDFCAQWPLVYLKHISFQESSISLDVFWSGSEFRELMPEAVFMEKVQSLECPRCGAPLVCNIWPYSFPFNLPPAFEFNTKEIEKIARRTPFLVLNHPFAQKVFQEIQTLGRSAKQTKFSDRHFRARYDLGSAAPAAPELAAPPPEKTSEGRYNHAGLPVLYLGSTKECCILELGNPLGGVWGAEVSILPSLKILDLKDTAAEAEILTALVASSLVSAPAKSSGWDKPEYVFSRFVADCAQHSGFEAIRYPSTKAIDGDNLVILNRPDSWETIVKITDISKWPQISDKVGRR